MDDKVLLRGCSGLDGILAKYGLSRDKTLRRRDILSHYCKIIGMKRKS